MTKLPTGRHTQAIKAARQNEKKRKRNKSYKSRVNNAIKAIKELINNGKKEEADQMFNDTVSLIDKAVSKNLIHQNKASRLKSRLNKKINNLS